MACRVSSPRFVGRQAELESLDAVLRRAADGIGGAVLVAGEAGIGKSRLMAQLEARAAAAGAVVLLGECLEFAEGQLAFAPMIAALRPVVGDPELVVGLDPVLRSAVGALWPGSGSAAAHASEREQLFEAVYRVIARLSARQPVLLVVEDVHWIDPSSRDLLAFIVHNTRRDRVVVVITCGADELRRGHPLRTFLAELERSGRSERLELEGLERDEVAEQIAAIAGRRLQPAAVEAIFARSEGDPFFVEELLAGADAVGESLRSSLREALLLRIERLSPYGRDVMAGAAAIGRSSITACWPASCRGRRTSRWQRFATPTNTTCSCRRAAALRTGFAMRCCARRSTRTRSRGSGCALHRQIAETLTAHPELAGAEVGAAAELAHHWYAARELPEALAGLGAGRRRGRSHVRPSGGLAPFAARARAVGKGAASGGPGRL